MIRKAYIQEIEGDRNKIRVARTPHGPGEWKEIDLSPGYSGEEISCVYAEESPELAAFLQEFAADPDTEPFEWLGDQIEKAAFITSLMPEDSRRVLEVLAASTTGRLSRVYHVAVSVLGIGITSGVGFSWSDAINNALRNAGRT